MATERDNHSAEGSETPNVDTNQLLSSIEEKGIPFIKEKDPTFCTHCAKLKWIPKSFYFSGSVQAKSFTIEEVLEKRFVPFLQNTLLLKAVQKVKK
tara:strand:+ start:1720 stop:2007 length:288 start_codon:yes stop_codon:yes gene_type:complete